MKIVELSCSKSFMTIIFGTFLLLFDVNINI